jgi:hypothetical protein
MEPSVVENSSVHEPELDMKRGVGRPHAGLMRWLILSILGYPRSVYAIGAPRRSIDREEQEYSPSHY